MSPEFVLDTTGEIARDQRLEQLRMTAMDAGRLSLGHSAEVIPTDIEARPYQQQVWEVLEAVRAEGRNKALVHLATGLGKTTLAVVDSLKFIGDELAAQTGPDKKVPKILFTCHKKEILEQAAERYAEFAPFLGQGMYADGEKDLSGTVTFATLQSLHQNLNDIDREEFDYIICDEGHHAQATTFKRVFQHFKPKFKVALTATPDRMDDKNIRELFGKEVYSKSLSAAMAEGYLADVDYHIVFDDAVKKAIDEGFDPKTLKEIRELLENNSRNEAIAAQIKAEIHKIGLEKAKTIVFCEDIEQADRMAELLEGQAYHSGISDKQDRQKILKDFRSGGLQVITTRDMFNEGVDVPDARLIVFLRATSSRTVFEQQLGRGLRKSADKHEVSVLDFVANIERLVQIKRLSDEVVRHRPHDSGYEYLGQGEGLEPLDEEKWGITVRTDHVDFDFEKISLILLDKLETISNATERTKEYNQFTNDELIELALQLSPEEALRVSMIEGLSAAGMFPSVPTIQSRFKSLSKFQEACGFEPIKKGLAKEDLIDLWNERCPGEVPTVKRVNELGKNRDFVSWSAVNAVFSGGIDEFREACGYEARQKNEFSIESEEDIVSLAMELSPDKPLTGREMDRLAKEGLFPSYYQLMETGLFDTLAHFQEKCGFRVSFGRKYPDMTNDEIVQRYIAEFAPEEDMKIAELDALAKEGKFFGSSTLDSKFGNFSKFKKACKKARKDRDSA